MLRGLTGCAAGIHVCADTWPCLSDTTFGAGVTHRLALVQAQQRSRARRPCSTSCTCRVAGSAPVDTKAASSYHSVSIRLPQWPFLWWRLPLAECLRPLWLCCHQISRLFAVVRRSFKCSILGMLSSLSRVRPDHVVKQFSPRASSLLSANSERWQREQKAMNGRASLQVGAAGTHLHPRESMNPHGFMREE